MTRGGGCETRFCAPLAIAWVSPAAGGSIPVIYPATEEVIHEARAGTAEDIDRGMLAYIATKALVIMITKQMGWIMPNPTFV